MKDTDYYDPWSNTRTKNGIEADLVISALQKCIRRGEADLAARMAYELYITSPFHEEKMWNRLLVISVEDIGFGNTGAPLFVKTMNDLRKEFAYGDGDRPIFFIHAIRYLCQSPKERSSDHIKNIIMKEFEQGYVPEIPDYAVDMHTIKGRAMGRDVFFFLDEASKVCPQWEGYDDSYRQTLYKMCQQEKTACGTKEEKK
jgi:replication-associated recombination protein RarA